MIVIGVAACAGASPTPAGDAPEVRAAPAGRDAERHYAIWLGGAQIGTAEELERWTAAGVQLRRTEAMRFLRGDAAVVLSTTIEITADRRLIPSQVRWTETGQAIRRGDAVRDAAGWRVTDELGVHRLAGAAIPAELAPLIVRRDGRFAGPVFLPARGFAAGTGRIEPVAPGRLVARLTAEAGTAATAEATIDLGDDAMPIRIVDGEGVIATRITAAQAAAPFVPVDLIAATSIPLAGEPPRPGADRVLALDGELALPALPGQAARATADGVDLTLSPALRGGPPPGAPGADRTPDILTLVAHVHRRIAPDLAARPADQPGAARTATAGDCTTFALAYAALAGDRGIPTRIVTGFRVDGDRLIRHRWAISWTGRAWIAVDAAFGAVPAGGDLVGVAVHDAGDLGLVAGETALARLRAAAWRD